MKDFSAIISLESKGYVHNSHMFTLETHTGLKTHNHKHNLQKKGCYFWLMGGLKSNIYFSDGISVIVALSLKLRLFTYRNQHFLLTPHMLQ